MADIRHAVVIDAPTEKILPLCSSASGFRHWWAADSAELGKEGSAELGFFSKSTVYRLHPSKGALKEIIWKCDSGDEWLGTEIRFRLEPNKNSTLLHFTHGKWKKETDYFVLCNTTWGELMYRLKAAAEGKTPGPLFTNDGLAI
jgi:hypothetical protein